MNNRINALLLIGIMLFGVACDDEDDGPTIEDITITHSSRGSFATDIAVSTGQEARTDYYAVTSYAFGTSISIYRPYFSFDLSDQNGTVSGAVLRIYSPANGYDSPDDSETLAFYEVETPTADLLTEEDNEAINIDLGDGALYGSVEVTATDNDNYVEVILNAEAISAINASLGNGTWSLGASITTAKTDESHTIEQVFYGSDASQPDTELVLTIEH